jgi:hypothetical protein
MHSFKRSLAVSLSSAAVLLGFAVPMLASAAGSNDGHLKVYVDVDDRYSNDDANDFTVRVDGDDVSKDSFRGSDNGTTVYVDGWYSVSVRNASGYSPSYSSGCHGDIEHGDSETCRITLRDRGNNNNYDDDYYYGGYTQYPQQYYSSPCGCQQYAQPVTFTYASQNNCGCQVQPTVVTKYIPSFPNTGFEPVNTAVLSLVIAAFGVLAALALPYVRKTLAAIVR